MIDESNFEINMANQKDLIIKTLVDYFGKENEEVIIKRFNNISFNFYLDIDKIEDYKKNYKYACLYNISKKILDKLSVDTTYYTLRGETEKYGYILDEKTRLLVYHLFNEDFLLSNDNNFSKSNYDCLSFLQSQFNDIDAYGDVRKYLKNPEVREYYDTVNRLFYQGLKEYIYNKKIGFDNLFALLQNKPLHKFKPINKEPNVQLDMFLNNREEICTTNQGISNVLMDVLTVNDITLTHEILHAISLHEIIDFNKVTYTTGFNTIIDGKMLNEVITQRLSRDICVNLNKNSQSFTDNMIKGTYFKCEYEKYFPLIEPFFNKHKELIKYTYLTGQSDIFEVIGEDNLNNLSDLITKAYIEKDIDKYLDESEQIFNNMKEYSARTK